MPAGGVKLVGVPNPRLPYEEEGREKTIAGEAKSGRSQTTRFVNGVGDRWSALGFDCYRADAIRQQRSSTAHVHHRSIATSAASSTTVPRRENRIGSPTRTVSRIFGDAVLKPVVLAGRSPRISSCVITISCA